MLPHCVVGLCLVSIVRAVSVWDVLLIQGGGVLVLPGHEGRHGEAGWDRNQWPQDPPGGGQTPATPQVRQA